MALMTVDEMREQLSIFKYKSRSAVHNFLRTREVQPVCRGEKKYGKGSGQNIYDPKVVQAAYDKHPIAGGGKVKRCLSYAQRKYKKPSEVDDFEFGVVKSALFAAEVYDDDIPVLDRMVVLCDDPFVYRYSLVG